MIAFGDERYHASPVKDGMIMDTVYVCGRENTPWFLLNRIPCEALLPAAMLLATISALMSVPWMMAGINMNRIMMDKHGSGPGLWTEKTQLAPPFSLHVQKRKTSSL